jgi:hypothetical protein
MRSRKFWIPFGVASSFLAGPAWSDTKELGPESALIEAPALVSSRGNVEQRSGASSFTYDFELPPGRDGLTPSLRLSYSSNRGNTWVGRGFYLDTPMIRRDTRDGVPRYDAGDRFVLESGDGIVPLVPWAAHTLGQEYRAARDSEEVQYILRPDGTWLVRRRDGVEELFSPSVHALKCLLCDDSRMLDNTFAWRLSQVRDRNDNVIDYVYESALPDIEQAMRMPRLSEVWYGGNDRVGLPHVFHVVLARDQDPSPPAALSDLPAPRHDCKRERGHEPLSFAPGGKMLDPDGIYELLRGVAVEIAWPGSTHEGVVAREARRVRTWQLGYNWDDVGCFAARDLWPQLTSVHERGYDDHGGFVERPAVTFDYYGWERTLTRVGDVPLPPATRLTPWGSSFFRHGVLVTAPNGSMSSADHFRGVLRLGTGVANQIT